MGIVENAKTATFVTMANKNLRKLSKFLSLILRHKPQTVGLELDAQGWADTDTLIEKISQHRFAITREDLEWVVEHNDKKRFVFSEDGSKIRANQGHSLKIDLALPPVTPPEVLYHGTAERNLDSIRESGLLKRKRHHVHLSGDTETALNVGKRYGKPVLLIVRAGEMHTAGHPFFCSENGVWLTEHVAPDFIDFP